MDIDLYRNADPHIRTTEAYAHYYTHACINTFAHSYVHAHTLPHTLALARAHTHRLPTHNRQVSTVHLWEGDLQSPATLSNQNTTEINVTNS